MLPQCDDIIDISVCFLTSCWSNELVGFVAEWLITLFIFTQLLKKYSMPDVEAWCMSAVQGHDAGHVLYIDFIDFLLIH